MKRLQESQPGSLARLGAIGLVLGAVSLVPGSSGAAPGALTVEPRRDLPAVIFVDDDDDNDNGVADRAETTIALVQSPQAKAASQIGVPQDALALREVPLAAGALLRIERTPAGKAQLGAVVVQARTPGLTSVAAAGGFRRQIAALKLIPSSGLRTVEPARDHVALSRTLESTLTSKLTSYPTETEAISWLLIGPAEAQPTSITLISLAPNGQELDRLRQVPAKAERCPEGTPSALTCLRTSSVRLTIDLLESLHPLSSRLDLKAEVGGRVSVHTEFGQAQSLRVGGPHIATLPAPARLRGELAFHVLRTTTVGDVAIGGSELGARALLQREQAVSNALWGQCGVHFGDPRALQLEFVAPPPAFLLDVGCESGLVASGGQVRFSIGSKNFTVPSLAGDTPEQLGNRIALALLNSGFVVKKSPNPRVSSSSRSTLDLLVFDQRKAPVEIRAAGPLSTDASLKVCLGAVDLSDGLTHFSDDNSAAGSLEERTLLKSLLLNEDSATINVFVVPHFAGSGRIGESFVDGPGASIKNVVVLDRAAFRAGPRSNVLAHELGHVLLDLAGHPDDFALDQPWLLMDADAADATLFGPRHLRLEDCERLLLQSGPASRRPLLEDWPLY